MLSAPAQQSTGEGSIQVLRPYEAEVYQHKLSLKSLSGGVRDETPNLGAYVRKGASLQADAEISYL